MCALCPSQRQALIDAGVLRPAGEATPEAPTVDRPVLRLDEAARRALRGDELSKPEVIR